MTNIAQVLFIPAMLVACVDSYDYPFEETGNSLVVEAAISSKPGPHAVRLSTTRNIYNKNNQHTLYVTGAEVSVLDSDGVRSFFTEKGNGYYYSDSSFRAATGKSYRLRIETKEGTIYESDEELAAETSEIHSIAAEYAVRSEKNKIGKFVEAGGFNVKALVNDTPGQRNYYLLRINIVYKILTYPELYQIFTPTDGYIAAPKSCCNICWINEQLPEFVVYGDQLIDGQTNAEIPLMFFKSGSKYFYDKVYFQVTQYSLSAGAYVFWKSLSDLKVKQGTLFDPSPASLPGNIHNVANEKEQVIGYFTVSGVSSRGDFITRDMIPGRIRYDYVFKDDCRVLANSTTDEPGFWR